MAMSFPAVFERWAYGIGRSHHDHLGRTDVRRVLIGSIRRDCLDHVVVFGEQHLCSTHIKNITTKLAPTCHCTRMHRSPAPSRPSVTRWPCPFWAGCTTNIYECEFPTGTGFDDSRPRQPVRRRRAVHLVVGAVWLRKHDLASHRFRTCALRSGVVRLAGAAATCWRSSIRSREDTPSRSAARQMILFSNSFTLPST